MKRTEKKSVIWIDCAKFLAILAVLVDHGKGILYEGETIQYISFFSVAVFFFLSGMTSWYSLERRRPEETFARWTARRVWRIFAPYMVAVAVCQFFKSGYSLSLGPYILWVLNFNLEGQFYFVLIYLQLIAAAPVLYLLTKYCRRGKFSFLWRLIYLGAAGTVSIFCMKHTFALQTYGGGNYLLGGTYLFLFVMGLIAADMQIRIRYRSRAVVCAAASTVVFAAVLIFLLKDRLALDEALFGWALRVNPPGITMTVYSLAVIFLIFSWCSLGVLTGSRAVARLLDALAWLGRYTLYIFLYHMLILEYLPAVLPFLDEVSLLKAAVYLGVMIALPVGGKLLYDRLRRSLLKKAAEEKPVGKKAAEDSASLLEKPPFKGGSE
ncbi:MAG TPA: acyltransferase [Candidatus Eisenbergiella merdipullorum]|uniref:Acyltransferase n=1 Tax=Candidatus Eisenbergiella merdipullorum TaxID=2838553 RepID=A0A9D2I5R5_9FIRM|nr:acyltransferase [Candidatus Eisenbergiella merdipullorum]